VQTAETTRHLASRNQKGAMVKKSGFSRPRDEWENASPAPAALDEKNQHNYFTYRSVNKNQKTRNGPAQAGEWMG
jgi:hypothetical protein